MHADVVIDRTVCRWFQNFRAGIMALKRESRTVDSQTFNDESL